MSHNSGIFEQKLPKLPVYTCLRQSAGWFIWDNITAAESWLMCCGIVLGTIVLYRRKFFMKRYCFGKHLRNMWNHAISGVFGAYISYIWAKLAPVLDWFRTIFLLIHGTVSFFDCHIESQQYSKYVEGTLANWKESHY